jgi:peptidyl-prolyl cis-trans isomerase C
LGEKVVSVRAGLLATIPTSRLVLGLADPFPSLAPVLHFVPTTQSRMVRNKLRRKNMLRIPRFWLSLLVAGSLSLFAIAQQPVPTAPPAQPTSVPGPRAWPTGTAATVNGEPLSEAAVQRALLSVPKDKQDQVRAEIVEDLIDQILMDQYLQQLNPKIDTAQADKQLEEIRKDIEKQGKKIDEVFASLYLSEKEVKSQIFSMLRWEAFVTQRATDEALKSLFAKEPEIVDGTKVRVRHILITPKSNDAKVCDQAEADLKQIKLQIEKQVADGLAKLPPNADNLARERERCKLLDEAFSAIARDKSDCPSGKSRGGEVDSFTRLGQMVEPFARAAFAVKPYQMTDVVKTQFGYHLILVTKRDSGTPVKFEALKGEITEVFGYRLRNDTVVQLRKQSKIVINPPPAKTTEGATK